MQKLWWELSVRHSHKSYFILIQINFCSQLVNCMLSKSILAHLIKCSKESQNIIFHEQNSKIWMSATVTLPCPPYQNKTEFKPKGMHQTLQQQGRKFACKGRYICLLSESLLMFVKQLMCYPREQHSEATLAWAVPWKSSDLPPLLHAEAPGPVAPPERGKAFIGNAGCACDKLAAKTRVRTGLGCHTGAGGGTQQHTRCSPKALGKAFAKQQNSWGTSNKCCVTWRLRANRPCPGWALEEAT